ncbi:MAG: DUF2301 domain-containing membrane protein [Leptolyngbyaceae cyanobacterium RU_5_1]|nr:DUF2301 domain-containing membrane protein [Leptolyngbyaceae cyanobacterium RU_5_1]
MTPSTEPIIYQGHFGEFTITESDRRGVIIYRSGLIVAALCFAIGTGLALWQVNNPVILTLLSLLYSGFCLGLGVSLLTIHIYMEPLHRALQVFWAIGVVAAIAIAHASPTPFALTVYDNPLAILGIGFTFAALTGIFFKEAFCFNRLETKLLTPLIPVLLLGHLMGWLSSSVEQILLATWAVLFMIFALRKAIQAIPPDIGDKSVFTYLHESRGQKVGSRG